MVYTTEKLRDDLQYLYARLCYACDLSEEIQTDMGGNYPKSLKQVQIGIKTSKDRLFRYMMALEKEAEE